MRPGKGTVGIKGHNVVEIHMNLIKSGVATRLASPQRLRPEWTAKDTILDIKVKIVALLA